MCCSPFHGQIWDSVCDPVVLCFAPVFVNESLLFEFWPIRIQHITQPGNKFYNLALKSKHIHPWRLFCTSHQLLILDAHESRCTKLKMEGWERNQNKGEETVLNHSILKVLGNGCWHQIAGNYLVFIRRAWEKELLMQFDPQRDSKNKLSSVLSCHWYRLFSNSSDPHCKKWLMWLFTLLLWAKVNKQSSVWIELLLTSSITLKLLN